VTPDHDVIVVGAGLIGAVAALGLADTGRGVLLVDKAAPEPSRGRFDMDIRNIACSPGSAALLQRVGVWSDLEPAPYRCMEVWEERGTATLTFEASEVGRQELGWILENSPTVLALWDKLERAAQVDILLGEVTAVHSESDQIAVEVAGKRHTANLLVAADGARSNVRTLVNTQLDTLATGQHALVTVVQTERGHDGVAYQRFLLDGPLALLPSRQADLSSVVWSQSPELASGRLAATDEEFCAALGGAMEHQLGLIVAVDTRRVFPLQQHVVADFNPLDRVLLIGDAARVLHPLAGLGANVGFEDVRDLLTRFSALPPAADPGMAGIWRAFARKRRLRAQLMVAAMAGFRQVYAEGGPLRGWLRNSAVSWVNQALPLKQQIIREALGLGPLAETW
jgi:2-octaprenylphenol hydroxylase